MSRRRALCDAAIAKELLDISVAHVVHDEFFIGDAGDFGAEPEEYKKDWIFTSHSNCEGDLAATSSCEHGKATGVRTRRRGKQKKQSHPRLRNGHRVGEVSADDFRNVGDPVAHVDTACHVLVSTPELRLRNSGVG